MVISNYDIMVVVINNKERGLYITREKKTNFLREEYVAFKRRVVLYVDGA
jgi:hypothetical protein